MTNSLKAFNLIDEIRAVPANKAGQMVFYARQFADPNILPLAPADTADITEISEESNVRIITIHAPEGLPYGCFARMILSYLVTLIKRGQGSKKFLTSRRKLYQEVTGQRVNGQKQLKQFIEVFIKFITSDISIRETQRYKKNAKFFSARAVLSDLTVWDAQKNISFELSDSFIKLVKAVKPHPIDARALRFLWKNNSPLAIDLYCWITYRSTSLKMRKQILFTWKVLEAMFPNEEKRTLRPSVFRNRLIAALKLVKICYPALNATIGDQGMYLMRSPPHVPEKGKQ